MMNRWILIALSLFAGLYVLAETPATQNDEEKGKVYRRYHPDGVVEFSDKPLKGGDELKVEEVPTYRFSSPDKPASTGTSSTSTPLARPANQPKLRVEKRQPGPYSSLAINSPSRDQSIRANDGNVNVSFNLLPALQHDHRIIYLLDGKQVLETRQAKPLTNLDRGTHTLVLQVVDMNNKVLIYSDSVTFHVKRYFKPRNKQAPATPSK